MAKEKKQPSVHDQLSQVEGLIAREQERAAKTDPLALNPANPDDALAEQGERDDLLNALSNAAVRRVFFKVFQLGGLFDADGDPNPTVMAHHVGRRSLALDLYRSLKAVAPGVYSQMEREHESNLKSKEKKPDAD